MTTLLLILVLLLAAALAAAIFYIAHMRRERELDAEVRIQSARQEQARNRMLEMLAQGAPLPRILKAIALSVEEEMPEALCSILLVNNEGTHLYTGAASSLPDSYNDTVTGTEIAMGAGSFGTAAYTGQRVVVEDIQTHPYWTELRDAALDAGLYACWAEVIRFTSSKGLGGKVLGVIAVYHREQHQPDEDEIALVGHAANLAQVALARAHADQSLRQNEQMLSEILENVSAHIYMKDPQGRYLFANRPLRERFDAPLEEIVGYDDSKFFDAGTAAAMREAELRVLTEGEPQESEENLPNMLTGLTEVFLTVRIPLRREEDGGIYALCGISTDISARKEVEEHMQHMAQYDNLTHLPNRALFDDRLRQALAAAHRNSMRLALMFIDLDKFKPVNDNYGHGVGDLLLQEVALRIQDCLRESDTAARVGGDEFVVLLPTVESVQDAAVVGDKVLAALRRPFNLAGHTLQIGGSIGVAIYPDHGSEEKPLVKSADTAMYHAKKNGRNNVKIYQAGMEPEAKEPA